MISTGQIKVALSFPSLSVARTQIHAEECLLDPTIHALTPQASVKSGTAGAHNLKAAQITRGCFTHNYHDFGCDVMKAACAPPYPLGYPFVLLKKVNKEQSKFLVPMWPYKENWAFSDEFLHSSLLLQSIKTADQGTSIANEMQSTTAITAPDGSSCCRIQVAKNLC